MPLRNRVDPFKQLHAVEQRGAWFGNRGCLHNDKGELKRHWQLERWIICTLAFKDRKRPLLVPGRYTELFFMDEATAFAAGHRPCKECRRGDAVCFQKLSGFPSLKELDAALHRERLNARPLKHNWQDLPNGSMIAVDNIAYLIFDKKLYQWSFGGYAQAQPVTTNATILTPPISLKVLSAGYPVQIDPSLHHQDS
jgi:hypothetical protein